MTKELTSIKWEEDPNYPLNEDDIQTLLDGKVNIIPYSKIHFAKSITELINPYDACIILYEAKPNYGHWCALLRVNNTNLIEFFDPYGEAPDEQLGYIDKEFREETFQNKKYLTALLINYVDNEGGTITWNDVDFQKLAPKIKTCGRWCVLRIALKMLYNVDFTKIVEIFREIFSFDNKDELVTLLTSIDLNGETD